MSTQFRDVFCQSANGLKLHAKVIGPNGTALPVLCLPGLTRRPTISMTSRERLPPARLHPARS
jgi:hypothetical protein